MSRAGDWRSRWAGNGSRITATRAPAVAGAVLALLGVAESTLRIALVDVSAQYASALFVLALATTLPVALLRAAPGAFAICASCVVSLALFHVLTVAGVVALLIVLYRVGRTGSRPRHLDVTAGVLAVPFVVLVLAGSRSTSSEAAVLTLILAASAPAAMWAGIAHRERAAARLRGSERRIIAGTLIEHAARGERARIVRELHDVVAHHVSMVAVQAETARLTTVGMPELGAQRLSAIGDTARAALTEMRRLLGVLREDADAEVPERHPQPGLEQLIGLLDEARDASGSGARLILSGQPVALDPGVELAAYRIAQEALTNARRHAPGAAVDVELRYTENGLRLRIRDNGPGPSPSTDPGGHGLPGMRERAAAVDGELRVGPVAGGGFLVEAMLPLSARPTE